MLDSKAIPVKEMEITFPESYFKKGDIIKIGASLYQVEENPIKVKSDFKYRVKNILNSNDFAYWISNPFDDIDDEEISNMGRKLV